MPPEGPLPAPLGQKKETGDSVRCRRAADCTLGQKETEDGLRYKRTQRQWPLPTPHRSKRGQLYLTFCELMTIKRARKQRWELKK